MPGAYHQLLNATIDHLESLKQRGVRYVDASPESLSHLVKPAAQKITGNLKSLAIIISNKQRVILMPDNINNYAFNAGLAIPFRKAMRRASQ